MKSTDVTTEIKRLCGKTTLLENGWNHFVYRDIHYVYIPDEANGMIRISVPHVVNRNDYEKDIIDAAVNETNREVKFIKAMVLDNGSITLNYDHRIADGEKAEEIVPHIIQVLYAAAVYLTEKVKNRMECGYI